MYKQTANAEEQQKQLCNAQELPYNNNIYMPPQQHGRQLEIQRKNTNAAQSQYKYTKKKWDMNHTKTSHVTLRK